MPPLEMPYDVDYDYAKDDAGFTAFMIKTEHSQIVVRWLPTEAGRSEVEWLGNHVTDLLYSIALQEGLIPDEEVDSDPTGQ